MRIMRACAELGVGFAAVYTNEDAESGHLDLARELKGDLVRIRSYTDPSELFSAADFVTATAVHPGYGFFAENHRFARRVTERERPMLFIGPSWRIIRDLGDKINTKRIARKLGVPTIPGSDRAIYDELEAQEIAASLFSFQEKQDIKKPLVLVKAAAGGGGMGIEEVHDIDRFRQVYRRIRNYAKRQFNDEGVLIEQRIFDFNHLEVQIVSDKAGKCHTHFGTRNCSVQSPGRQKRVEVAPGFYPAAVNYDFDAKKVLREITRHSLNMAREVSYDSVGTWEWIVTPKGDPFLMEVNTRIQVENGVSAVISRIGGKPGVNLVREQIRLGLGEDMGYTQEEVSFDGVAIEYRIVAEDTENRFAPWVGLIEEISWKPESWLQMFTQIPLTRPYQIPTEYDPNLALAIVWGQDLKQAKERGYAFLDNFVLRGRDRQGSELKSNLSFLRDKTKNILEFKRAQS